jgi:uncharacterized LabA/DUF88 family protein
VDVIKMEEKGSDVNLATYMLVDGFRGDYDIAAVVSNDSDLCEPIRFVRQDLGKQVWMLSPGPKASSALRKVADQVRTIHGSTLARCQFPPTLTDANGTITKPAGWR